MVRSRQTLWKGVLLVGIGIAAVRPVQADTTISTYGKPTGGFSSTFPVQGQTFTTPSDNVLKDFSIKLGLSTPSLTITLFAWDDSTNEVTGSALFTSGPVSGTSFAGGLRFTFVTGGLALMSGQQYAALLTGPVSPDYWVGPYTVPPDAYFGGKAISGFGVSSPFLDFLGDDKTMPADFVFEAHFSSVPEPAFYQMGALLVGGGLLLLRRKCRGTERVNRPALTLHP